jgi:CBS domain-containing membrane protein
MRDIMSRDLVTLAEDDTLADARRCMEQGRIRHLPVVRLGKLVGLVTHRDLLAASFSMLLDRSAKAERSLFSRTPVREVMQDVVAVAPDTSVRDATNLLIENKFGCLPVVTDDGTLVGIVTEADMVRLVARMLEAIHA